MGKLTYVRHPVNYNNLPSLQTYRSFFIELNYRIFIIEQTYWFTDLGLSSFNKKCNFDLQISTTPNPNRKF